MSKTSQMTTAEWNQLNWRKLEKAVFKLQKRIFRASQRGDVASIRKLQKTLIRSWSAKCIAVRKVTQDNTGKKTAGVGGVKSLSPVARLSLVNKLRITGKSKPTRRVWIPKPGSNEKRPLGIPTMYDRALQALAKLALEPEWEARFEPNSYGFRPGRSCHDAIGAIFGSISKKDKYVLDADISKCFDKINHDALIDKVNTFPTLRYQIKAWLKAGVMDGNSLFLTTEGTPQGGVISPLLANIALHGMENQIKRVAEILPGEKRRNLTSLSLIRYADDFVIMHEEKAVVEFCQHVIAEWLNGMGLKLNPSKTKIVHTSEGFNFLGFNVRQYKVGAYRSSRNTKGKILGFNTLITPSPEKVKKHLEKIGKIIDIHHNASQATLISRLNPVIKGWCNYYSAQVSKEIYAKCDHLIYEKLRAWGNRKCTGSKAKEVTKKYWRTIGNNNWEFAAHSGSKLYRHTETPIVRHIKVQNNRSPYDGDFIYWSERMGKHPEAPKRVAILLKEQKGKCPHCGLMFKHDDLLEVDHIIPKIMGGKDEYENFQLLHRHCHDVKSVTDRKPTNTEELTDEYLETNPF
ncbi:MAG: group II intron reverse transcriptase/maturase [Spirirestis rafaelensis WJT71-NPBG6]|jgi:RNA-directed DNA polymerase|nr:group II intron reverse transcriptase/maturase [Spirirestis rafaelensis WJT71-NPBG6]